MLKSPKKLALTQVQPTHVDLFVENYDLLKQWALRFTERDHELAEDLLHDTFIQFTISKPDLDAIDNLEGYLFIVMRNLHLSQMRRATRTPLRALSVVEFDTVDVSFWASDPRDRMRMRDELGAVCQYACIRKETAKVGSVLILRFFHGYYPEEIAQVMLTNRSAVEKRLQKARAEVKLYLESPDRLSFIDKDSLLGKPAVSQMGEDMRLELRRQIFNSRQGECSSSESLNTLYEKADHAEEHSLDQRTAAHIVSCQPCLDSVNSLLGLPPLASRYPLDTLGKDPGKGGHDNTGGGGTTGGGSGDPSMLDSYLNRRDALFHHQPRELCISVNGHLQTFQKVVAGKGELTVLLDTSESLGFVEVFSEQGMRLLMMNVEPPPAGDGKQSAHIELSSGRTVDANLNFSGERPALQISYFDPELSADTVGETTEAPNAGGAEQILPPFLIEAASEKAGRSRNLFDGFKNLFQPAKLAAAFGVLVAIFVGLLYLNRPVETPLTAAAVLENATRNEIDITARPDLAVRSSYRVEEYSNGQLLSKRRVDQWQKSDASARRVFDDKEKMIAGEWRSKDGKSQVFEQGQKLLSVPPAAADGSSEPENNFANIKPSAKQFAALIENAGVSSQLKIQESPLTYEIKYVAVSTTPSRTTPASETLGHPSSNQEGSSPATPPNQGGEPRMPGELLLASLVLDRNSLQPRSETIVLKVGDVTREYRFTDIHTEQKPVDTVSPLIFLPEAELLQGSTKVIKPVEVEEPGAELSNATNANANTITKNTATLETEVEVFKLLDAVNALSGEQISVTRSNGQLKVTGVVDSAQRKSEIVNALAPVKNGRGVVVEIETAEESAARKKKTSTTGNISIESVTVATDQSLPVETELRALLARRGVAADRMEDEMRAFATGVSASSRVLRRNALALKQIAERFTPAEVDRLEPAKREEWKALVRSRARAVAGDVKQLTAQLQPAFPGMASDAASSPPARGGVATASVDGVVGGAQRLFGLAAACDSQVSQSFAISSGGKGAAPVRSVQFWRSLAQMAGLAAELQKF